MASAHADYYFEIEAQTRVDTHFAAMATGVWREEYRLWHLADGRLSGGYTSLNILISNDVVSRWDSREPELEFFDDNYTGDIIGTEVEVSATAPGSYTARRAIHEPRGPSATGFGDTSAPFLHAGISTSLTINPDGSLFGQDGDGCVIQGKTDDHLGGVFRVNLTDSCLPGATFASFGATIDGRLYLAGHFNLETLKIVAGELL